MKWWEKALFATPFGLPYQAGKAAYKGAQGVGELWTGDKDRLSEIDKKIADSEQSPYNEMKAFQTPVTEELKDYYSRMKNQYIEALAGYKNVQGMTPAERAAAVQGQSQMQNLGMQTAQMAGGGGAGAYIGSVLGDQSAKFNLNLAGLDQEIKRQNKQMALSYLSGVMGQLGQTTGEFQDITTKNTMLQQDAFAKNFEKQMLAEQALGQARQDWYYNRDANRRAMLNAGVQLAGQGIQAISGMTGKLGSLGGAGGSAGGAAASAGAASAGAASLGPLAVSDIRLKKDIVYSHQENGYKIYEFRYTNGDNTRYLGVLAQEVMEINPDAVVQDSNGYYAVNYDMLGITMKKID